MNIWEQDPNLMSSMPRHILHITPYFPPSVNGIATVLDSMTNYEKRCGHRVTVISQMPQLHRAPGMSEAKEKEEMENMTIFRLFPRSAVNLSRWEKWCFEKKLLCLLEEIHNENTIDVIHIPGLFLLTFATAKFADRKGIKKIFSFYGEEFTFFAKKSFAQNIRTFIFRKRVEKLFHQMDGFTASGKNLYNEITEWFPDKPCEIILNGVVFSKFETATEKERHFWRKEEGLDEEVFVTVSVSAYEGRKGGMNYMRVFKELAVNSCNAKHLLIGEGQELTVMKAFVKSEGLEDRVIFKGSVSHDDLRRYYGLADAYLQLPRWESGVSLPTIEAQLMGLPAVVSDTEAMKDSVDPLNVSDLHGPEDEKSISSKLLFLANNKEERKRSGHMAKQWVRDNKRLFNYDDIAESYLQFFEERLNQ